MKASSQVAVTEAEDPLLGFLKKKEPEKKDQKKGVAVTEGGLAPFRGDNVGVRPAPASAPVASSNPRPLVSPAAPQKNVVNKLPDFSTPTTEANGNTVTVHTAKPTSQLPAATLKASPATSDPLLAPDAAEETRVAEPADAKSAPSYVQVEDYVEELKTTAKLLDRIQASVSPEVSELYIDDWANVSAQMMGEKPALLNIKEVAYCRPRRTIMGELVMTAYQLFFEPFKITKYSKRVYGSNTSGVISVPLASIERLDIAQVPAKSRREPGTILDAYCKDTRLLRFAFKDADQCKRASQVIAGYVFPGPENPKYLFCFAYQSALLKAFQTQGLWKEGPLAGKSSPVDGWLLYNPIREYKRMGLPTADLVISLVNENYSVCPTYPAVLALPSSFTEADIRQIANFRSRGRIPALSWKHPFGDQSIWRCSQPKTGVAGVRCLQDEELLKKIKAMNPGMKEKPLTIFDCRPRLNAWANKTAGKGFEDTQHYTSCKLRFMNIENIHTMRIAYQKLSKACQKQIDDQEFPKGVVESGWLFHLSEVIKATVEMVITVDRDSCSIMSHCSDGWDRTSQLVALAMLCLDPYYRTTVGFLRLIDKEWLSFGHKFGERIGHGDKNYNDEQRAPIFLQWLDCVYQFTCQFPRHFQFNSAFLVCLASHLYSCRFGTFLFDTECERDKFELKTKTASLWSYLLVSPAALDGHFTNPFYSFGGDGDLSLENCQQYRQTNAPQKRPTLPPEVTETVEGEILGDIVGEMGDDEEDELWAGPRTTKVLSSSQQHTRGSVLCPSWSLKRLTVWSDYFLRWNTEETQTIGHGVGLMPPYGSATTTLISSESLYHQQMRSHQRTLLELAEAKEKIRQLELQLKQRDAPPEEKKEATPVTAEDAAPATLVQAVHSTDQEADVEKNLDSLIAELDKELGDHNRSTSEPLSAALDPSATMPFDALVSSLAEDSLFTPAGSSDFPETSASEANPFDPSSPGFSLSFPHVSSQSDSSLSSSDSTLPSSTVPPTLPAEYISTLPSQSIAAEAVAESLPSSDSAVETSPSVLTESSSLPVEPISSNTSSGTSADLMQDATSAQESPAITESSVQTSIPEASTDSSRPSEFSTLPSHPEVSPANPSSHLMESLEVLTASIPSLPQFESIPAIVHTAHADDEPASKNAVTSALSPESHAVYDIAIDQLKPPSEGETVEEI